MYVRMYVHTISTVICSVHEVGRDQGVLDYLVSITAISTVHEAGRDQGAVPSVLYMR